MKATLSVQDGRLVIDADAGLLDVVRSLPGARLDKRTLRWTRPATPSSVAETAAALADAGAEPIHPSAEIALLAARYEAGTDAKGRLPAPPVDGPLWNHQQRGVDFCGYMIGSREPGGAAYLAWEMGTGKTFAALAYIQAAGLRRILVV